PIATITGLQLGFLLGGAVFTEVVFAWPGLGYQLTSSIVARDFPVVQAAVLLIALIFVLVNLAVDMLNAIIDPRIRASRRGLDEHARQRSLPAPANRHRADKGADRSPASHVRWPGMGRL